MEFGVQYLGHSAVIITLPSGKRVAIDPWLDTNPSCPKEFHTLSDISLICLTHGHYDHASSALSLAKHTKAVVCGTFELVSLLVNDGLPESQIQPMNTGGTITIDFLDNLRVTLTSALHSSSYKTAKGESVYAGDACGVVLRTKNGDSLYHAGDTALFSDMKLFGEIYKPRIAFLPIGDRFTMGPEDAAIAANLIKARHVVPIHWGTFSQLTGTPEKFKELLSGAEVTVEILKPGESRKL